MSQLIPLGWVETKIEFVIDILDSQRMPVNSDERAKRIDGKPQNVLVPYYGATGQVGYVDTHIFDEPLILLGEDGIPYFDLFKHKAYRISGKSWVNNHAHVLREKKGFIDGRYVEAFLNSFDYKGYVSGTTRLKLTQASMKEIPIPLAPYSEQKRIADKLDAVLARVDICRQRLNRVPVILKRFRQSILAAATSGKLTEDWRDQYFKNSKSDAFSLVPFGNLIKTIRGGSTEVPSSEISDFPILRSSSVRQGEIDFSDVKYLNRSQSTRVDNFIENGDILFTRLNGTAEYVGNCVVVTNVSPGKYQYPDRLFCAKLKDKIHPAYCMYAFSAPDVRREIETRAKSTAGHKRISIQDVKEIEIRLPSTIDEQQEIVRRVENLFAFADRLEARLVTARIATERLTPALLAKAFRGELVPQDPDDEPASELLARIVTQKSGQAKKTSAVKKSR